MEDDGVSTATMTSVTEDLSLDESDTSSNDIDTSSQITSSDTSEEGKTTVIDTPQQCNLGKQEEAEILEVSMDGGSEQDESAAATDQHPPVTHPPQQPKATSQQRSSHTQSSRSGIQIPDFMSMEGKWYEHECFNHYWRHYHFVSMWCQKHMETYRTVAEQHNQMIAQQTDRKQKSASNSQPPPGFKKPLSKKTIRNRKARRRRKVAKKRLKMAMKNASLSASCSSVSQSSADDQLPRGEGEGETTQSAVEGAERDEDMEITNEMLDFFAHTHKHRQERDALKKNKESGKEEKHINIEEGEGKKERTETAPVERPGSKRTSEIRLLYGKGAAMIHGMETALQMTFDRNIDVLQPRLWPNMPLRVIF